MEMDSPLLSFHRINTISIVVLWIDNWGWDLRHLSETAVRVFLVDGLQRVCGRGKMDFV